MFVFLDDNTCTPQPSAPSSVEPLIVEPEVDFTESVEGRMSMTNTHI